MKVYHHNDMDGRAAAFCVRSNYWNHSNVVSNPSDYIEINYNDNFDKHTNTDDVFLVDISISDATYEKLINLCNSARTVTWIDHHQTSLDIVNTHRDELQSIKNLTYFVTTCASAAVLTYSYLNLYRNSLQRARNIEDDEYYVIEANCEYIKGKNRSFKRLHIDLLKKTRDRDKIPFAITNNIYDMPEWLHLVDEFDCFKVDDRDRAIKFNYGVSTADTRVVIPDDNDNLIFNDAFWGCIEARVDDYLISGEVISNYLDNKYRNELSSTFIWYFEKYKFICKNCTGNSLEFMDNINKYDAAIKFSYDGKSGLWNYSVYVGDNSNFDASAFCKRFGGGGHTRAAGFSAKNLIFTNPKGNTKEKVIYINASSDSDWSQEFINCWNKSKNEKVNKYTIYSPTKSTWNKPNIDIDRVKKTSTANIYVLSGELDKDTFDMVEAVDCSYLNKTILIVYDKFGKSTTDVIEKYKSIGKLIENNGGIFRFYSQYNNECTLITTDCIKYFKTNDASDKSTKGSLMNRIVNDCLHMF